MDYRNLKPGISVKLNRDHFPYKTGDVVTVDKVTIYEHDTEENKNEFSKFTIVGDKSDYYVDYVDFVSEPVILPNPMPDAVPIKRCDNIASERVGDVEVKYHALTKRELLAGMAMQGILAAGPIEGADHSIEAQMNHCVRLTDALIAELEKTNDSSSNL